MDSKKSNGQAKIRLIYSHGVRVDGSSARPRSGRLRRSARRMHSKKLISGKPPALLLDRGNDILPSGVRYASPVLPFLASPMTDPNIGGHFRDGVPALKDVVYGFHLPQYVGDELSRQARRIIPVTTLPVERTICPMGRGSVPSKFKSVFAARLRAGRIAAGYESQQQFAAALGVQWERYKKWESGRTPMPHQYIPIACELMDKDANYLFGVHVKARKAA